MTDTTETQLSEAIRDANGPLRIQGGGTRPIGRTDASEILSTAGLSGVTLYDPGALTIVAKTGTPVAQIDALLANSGQRLAFEPMDHRSLMGTTGTPTIGGVVAGNVSGPRRIAVGACRDFLLGVTFVDGNGTITKNGGRVMKNVTGYDMVKLMCGSYGTLGVLTEVALKVLPIATTEATLCWRGLGWTAASHVMSKALGSPYDATGAARLPFGPEGTDSHSLTMIRVEGFADSVAYRCEKLRGLFSDMPPDHVSKDADWNSQAWQQVRDVSPLADQPGDVWRISVRPTDLVTLVPTLNATQTVLDWGGGLIWAAMPAGTDVRALMGDTPGHATLIRGTTDGPHFHPEPAPVAAITQGLRDRFDPRGILNPGLMT